MERALDKLSSIEMGRAERNQTIYKENEEYEVTETAEAVEIKENAKGPGFLGRLLGVIGNVLMVAVLVACLIIAIPKFAGYSAFVVVSGSMEPTIPVGSLVYSKGTDPKTLEPGDVVVFYSSDAGHGSESTGDIIPVTHRVVVNDTVSGELTTKGDANANDDISPVSYNNIVGKVAFHLPVIGYMAALLSSVTGKIAAILLILAGYLLTEAGRKIAKKS